MNHKLIMENWRHFINECENSEREALDEISWSELKKGMRMNPWVRDLNPANWIDDLTKEIKKGYWRDVLISLLIGAGLAGTTVLTKDLVVPKTSREKQELVKKLETSDDPEAKKALEIYNQVRKK